jgi:dUTP pyrophosphatase
VDRVRGFEFVTGWEDLATKPARGTANSAGYDFYATQDYVCAPGQVIKIKTGIKAYMLEDEFLQLSPRSSAANNHPGMLLCNSIGVIDSDYYNNPNNEGNIIFAYVNCTTETFGFKKGEKVGQGIFKKFLVADGDDATGSREGGFGSTGK